MILQALSCRPPGGYRDYGDVHEESECYSLVGYGTMAREVPHTAAPGRTSRKSKLRHEGWLQYCVTVWRTRIIIDFRGL
jgi:hypothetical protein